MATRIQDEKGAAAFRGVRRHRSVSGTLAYTLGLRQPALLLLLQAGEDPSAQALDTVDEFVRRQFGRGAEAYPGAKGAPVALTCVLAWVRIILEKNNHPVLEDARLWREGPQGAGVWGVAQPCVDFEACTAAFDLSLGLLDLAMREPGEDGPARLKRQFAELAQRFAGPLRHGSVPGFNQVHFIAAAHEMGVPWSRLAGNVIQYGQGSAARLLDSSFTDRTPQIAAAVARDKQVAASVMRNAGLPVPAHEIATSVEQALRIAERLGYPVVVKPADKDGGVGVAAFLHDARAVEDAYNRARTHSRRVLVEKHFLGLDYRIQVVGGVVHGVLERAPGGVVGDGAHSVRQLVERQNHERATATDDRRHLHPIKPDPEAVALLGNAGMNWDSVPEAGQFVRLRGAANVASGGIPRPIPLEAAHPDNLELALRAVRILRLDVAGVDLLVPDIGRSWLETGAAICEVNAQPQMFTTMHRPMLESLLGGRDGRIPSVLVVSGAPGEKVSEAVHQRMQADWPGAGRLDASGGHIGGSQIFRGNLTPFRGAQSLLRDPAVDALVLSVSDAESVRNGWPVDRIDVLVLAGGKGDSETGDEIGNEAERLATLVRRAAWLKPRMVLVDGGSKACLAAAQLLADGTPRHVVEPGGDINGPLAQAALESLRRRAR